MSEKIKHKTFPIKGRVTAKTCECCGHHEIGITVKDGKFFALKPGMMVKVIETISGNE